MDVHDDDDAEEPAEEIVSLVAVLGRMAVGSPVLELKVVVWLPERVESVARAMMPTEESVARPMVIYDVCSCFW